MIICKNPDEQKYREISQAIYQNDGYCCCALEHTPETKCMCKAFCDQLTGGFCHCGRYYKINKYQIIAICGDYDQYTANALRNQDYIVLDNRGVKRDIAFAQIAQADIIYVVNHAFENKEMQEQIQWACDLNKKILSLKPIDFTQYEK